MPLAPPLEKCVTDKTANACALRHIAQRFEHAANVAVLVAVGFPRSTTTLDPMTTTKATSPISAIFLSSKLRSFCRLNGRRSTVAAIAYSRHNGHSRPWSASTSGNQTARIISIGSAVLGAQDDRLLRVARVPPRSGQLPPVVTAATRAMVRWLMPVPGSPAKQVCFPRAIRRDQSHSIFSGVISAAQRRNQSRHCPASILRAARRPFPARMGAIDSAQARKHHR